jgi:hypothetical protein
MGYGSDIKNIKDWWKKIQISNNEDLKKLWNWFGYYDDPEKSIKHALPRLFDNIGNDDERLTELKKKLGLVPEIIVPKSIVPKRK